MSSNHPILDTAGQLVSSSTAVAVIEAAPCGEQAERQAGGRTLHWKLGKSIIYPMATAARMRHTQHHTARL